MIVVKIYDNYWSDTIIAQKYINTKVSINKDLGSFDEAIFEVDFPVKKYNKVEIYEAGNPDVLKFKGFVSDINITANVLNETTEVVCWSGKGLLQNRCVLYGEEEVSTPLDVVVENMIEEWNDLGDNWEYQIDYTDPIDMTTQLGTTCYSIIDELTNQVGGFRTVKDNKIIISSLIGEDKTFGGGEIEFFFDKTSASNVEEVSVNYPDLRASVAIGIASDGSKLRIDAPSISYPYGAVISNFEEGDLTEKTQKLLDDNNVSKLSYNVKLDPNSNYNVNIGDKVNLRIEGLDNIDDFTGSVYVNKKEIIYEFGKKYEYVEVGEAITSTGGLGSLIKNINDKVDKIRTGVGGSGGGGGAVDSVNGFTGAVVLTQDNIGNGSTYVRTHNDFTDLLKNKLDGIDPDAEENVQSDWNQTDTSADDYIRNKPTIPTVLNKTENDLGNSGTSKTINMSTYINHNITITDDCDIDFSSAVAGETYKIRVRQDATGGHSITLTNSGVRLPGGSISFSSGAGEEDLLSVYYNGTYFYCSLLNSFS